MLISRKGISPLIATVLLIAFTITVASILMNWVVEWQKSEKTSLTTTSETYRECRFKALRVKSVTYNCSIEGRLLVEIENIGQGNLNDFVAQVIYQNNSVSKLILEPDLTIRTGDVNFLYNDSFFYPGLSSLEISTSDCPLTTKQSVQVNEITKC